MQRKYKTTIIILLVTSATMQIIRQYQRNDMIARPLIEKLPLMTLFENIPLCITQENLLCRFISLLNTLICRLKIVWNFMVPDAPAWKKDRGIVHMINNTATPISECCHTGLCCIVFYLFIEFLLALRFLLLFSSCVLYRHCYFVLLISSFNSIIFYLFYNEGGWFVAFF